MMSYCRTCGHPERAAIDAALAAEPYRAVAARYGLPLASLARHWQAHGEVLARMDAAVEAVTRHHVSADRAFSELARWLGARHGMVDVATLRHELTAAAERNAASTGISLQAER